MSREQAGWYGCLALAAAIHVGVALPTLSTTVDDAWISVRFAQLAAEGHGLVYNAGVPPIEGFTNPLWTAWLTIGHLIGADLQAFLVTSGLAAGVASTVLAGVLTRALHPTRSVVAGGLAALIVGADLHLAIVATNGLETSLFLASVLLTATMLALDAPAAVVGLLAGLLVWNRPEGLALGPILAAAHLCRHPRQLAPLVAAFLVPWILLFTWRLSTYGAWLPNTFDAKSDGGLAREFWRNLAYLSGDAPLWVAPALAALVGTGLAVYRRALLPLVLLVCVAVCTLSAFRVYMWMPGGRLLVLPATLATVALLADPSRKVWGLGAVWFLLALAANITPWGEHDRNYDRVHSVVVPNDVSRGMSHLRAHLSAGSVITTRDAGVVAAFSSPSHLVYETHNRALTLPHVDGRDLDVRAHIPDRPDVIVVTVRSEDDQRATYGNDRTVLRRAGKGYAYLGRLRQHHRRHYDVYVRADLGVPPFDPSIVTNMLGVSDAPAP